jgi:hypothetical protein
MQGDQGLIAARVGVLDHGDRVLPDRIPDAIHAVVRMKPATRSTAIPLRAQGKGTRAMRLTPDEIGWTSGKQNSARIRPTDRLCDLRDDG